jgi:hypothetical protein
MYACLASWLYFWFELAIKVGPLLSKTLKAALDARSASLCMHAWLASAACSHVSISIILATWYI